MRANRILLLSAIVFTLAECQAHAADSLYTVVTLVGDSPGQHLGRVMAGVGDVSGDGFADLAVGDPGRNECRLYLGGWTVSDDPALIIARPETCPDVPSSDFGRVVAGGRDVNGDGFADLLVTNQEWFYGMGKAYLYYGGVELDTLLDVAIPGPTAGAAICTRGYLLDDVNGDSCAEVAILTYWEFEPGPHVFLGGAPMDSVQDLGLYGPGFPIFLGSDIASGDLNGDGFGDIVVGVYGTSPQLQTAAWIYFGDEAVDETPDVILSPPPPLESRRYGVAVPGDMNGDGFDDVVVGPTGYTEPGVDEYGCAHVYFGSTCMDSVTDLALPGRVWGGVFAISGGDLNLDGDADIVTAQVSISSSISQSWLRVYFGGADMDSVADIEVPGPHYMPGPFGFGETVAWIGDMNGDGWPEFAVSDPEAAGGRGEIYIYTLAEVDTPPSPLPLPDPVVLTVAPNPGAGPLHISWHSTSMSPRGVDIADIDGRLVRNLIAGPSGALVWDGCNGAGIPVPSGVYVVCMREGDVAHSAKAVVVR